MISPKIKPFFTGLQLGVCNPGGTDIMVHLTRAISQLRPNLTASWSGFSTESVEGGL